MSEKSLPKEMMFGEVPMAQKTPEYYQKLSDDFLTAAIQAAEEEKTVKRKAQMKKTGEVSQFS